MSCLFFVFLLFSFLLVHCNILSEGTISPRISLGLLYLGQGEQIFLESTSAVNTPVQEPLGVCVYQADLEETLKCCERLKVGQLLLPPVDLPCSEGPGTD